MLLAVLGVVVVTSVLMVCLSSFSNAKEMLTSLQVGVAWLLGARFDVAANQLVKGKLSRPKASDAQKIIHDYDHGEL